ncbi:hypothetical protein PFICI_02529 [Pestalotiopsis fici W106-1]|uniref:Heterokaryon incompatibility domain-containing protein n=1 Tax=Pestalotiopsis fici (strain W106-1 / CGMCC3.15140) TaxID=1229662 RepID=W3XER2_PESFW|nr:uncharacterized protein PFICI_02529 [Pestalotiopsis fici W106-1]ETS84504.1 hypothetical protein PFICI_02529 [Pestalotiopsis fici W106-1]
MEKAYSRHDGQMTRFEEASRIAKHLGLRQPNQDDECYFHSLLASKTNAEILQRCNETLLNLEERARACQGDHDSHADQALTKLIFRTETSEGGHLMQSWSGKRLCVFISDGAGQQETWTLIRELKLTIRKASSDGEIEVTVIAGKEIIARILYDKGFVLLRCQGRAGLALELLTAATQDDGEDSELDNATGGTDHTDSFDTARSILSTMIGIATVSNLIDRGVRASIPSGASHWLPREMLDSVVNLTALTRCEDGFIDLRQSGLEYYVRPVRPVYLDLLCPACWVTTNSSKRQMAQDRSFIAPLRLMPLSKEKKEYTAVSYLWSEFKGDDTLKDMQKSAAAVGAPTSLWVDRVCINQNDPAEKALEISRMGSYYAGAHTTLIYPASKVVDIPKVKLNRHLVAIPEQLRKHHGLRMWKQDTWHDRVWTYQEGALSRNPQVFAAEMNTGLSASWLNFMSWAAEYEEPIKCDVALPPYYSVRFNRPWGECTEEERWSYRHTFQRSWTACSRHNWEPSANSIKVPLATLMDRTQLRKCSEPRDKILGILGLTASSESLKINMATDLRGIFCEAIRCGILGAEILLAGREDRGPRSWIPRMDSVVRWKPSQISQIGYICKAEQPSVDDDGNLTLRACEIKVEERHVEKGPQEDDVLGGYHQLEFTDFSGQVGGLLCMRYRPHIRGKAFILKPSEDAQERDFGKQILVFATEVGEGRILFHKAVKESQLGDRESMIQVGNTLGAGSSINLMIYIRAQQRDFDSWNMEDWTGDDLPPYLRPNILVTVHQDPGDLFSQPRQWIWSTRYAWASCIPMNAGNFGLQARYNRSKYR